MQEGVTEETAVQLAVEYPAYFTLPPASRARIGFFVGEVRSEFQGRRCAVFAKYEGALPSCGLCKQVYSFCIVQPSLLQKSFIGSFCLLACSSNDGPCRTREKAATAFIGTLTFHGVLF